MLQTRMLTVVLAGFLSLGLGGCLKPVVYVEEGHSSAATREIKPRDPRTPVTVAVEYYVNGERFPKGDAGLQANVIQVLQGSGVLEPVQGATATFKVVVDDQFDKARATSESFMTGLTLGMIGNSVADRFDFTVSYANPGVEERIGRYRHAVHTNMGKIGRPDSIGQPLSPADAFGYMVQESVLNFLYDLQQVGETSTPVLFVPEAK